jgi:hypothetical protein
VRRLLLLSVMILGTVGNVWADATPFMPPENQPIYIQFNNLEQVSGANNIVVPGGYNGANTQGNWGVVNISSIQLGFPSIPHIDIAGGPVIFSDDGPGKTQGQITGIFYGINLTSGTTATGGVLDLYWHAPGSDPVTAACLAGVTCSPNAATVTEFTSGTFLARLFFAPGIIPGDATTTISSTTDPTISGSGEADSFANVDLSTPGLWTNLLNGDWFFTDQGTRDVRFSNFFNGLPSWNGATGVRGLRSNDPARVFTTPEPGTLTLLGIGLFGVGLALRRKGR